MIFCGSKADLRYLCALFLCFEAVSGLKSNLAKSKMVPIGNVENVDGLAGILDCGIFSLSRPSVRGLL